MQAGSPGPRSQAFNLSSFDVGWKHSLLVQPQLLTASELAVGCVQLWFFIPPIFPSHKLSAHHNSKCRIFKGPRGGLWLSCKNMAYNQARCTAIITAIGIQEDHEF